MAEPTAITINVNPLSYVTIPIFGKMVRKRWAKHTTDDQKYFLEQFINLMARHGINRNDVTHRFEETLKGNLHIHLQVNNGTKVAIENAKEDFCAMVDRKMPAKIKDRCVLIKAVWSTGWVDYVTKQDPEPSSDDEPIEIPRRNIMIKHLKRK